MSKYTLDIIKNPHKDRDYDISLPLVNEQIARKVYEFHHSLPSIQTSPLYSLPNLASYLGVKNIWLKDEAQRCKLKAFKILGGSYAIYQVLKEKLGYPVESNVSFEEIKEKLKGEKMTFCAATDGNHGAGVALSAKDLGQACRIYMPKGTASDRVERIKGLDAEVIVTDVNYDLTVKMAAEHAKANGWVIISDTAWDGYEQIPRYVIQGYSTMYIEIQDQLMKWGFEKPTHIFMTVGVGSFASSAISFYSEVFKNDPPVFVTVEPENADCLYKSIQNGKLTEVGGDLATIMAGLSCGTVNPIAWETLAKRTDYAVRLADCFAATAMRILANPLGDDARVVAGESGVAGLGILYASKINGYYKDVLKKLEIDENSNILIVSTEGDTDSDNYRKILWEGKYQI